jgi:hypothetical protein
MSSKLAFISDHPIIYRAIEYIEQCENNSVCVRFFLVIRLDRLFVGWWVKDVTPDVNRYEFPLDVDPY